MQIAQSEILGVIDNNCICIRNIKPRLNYRGSNKNIILTFNKSKHYFFKLVAFHLSMRHNGSGLRNNLVQHEFHFMYILHPVMNEKYLSSARHLKFNGFFYNLFME